MELFEIVFYPLEQIMNMLFSNQLTEALGFSVPGTMVIIFIVNAVITVMFGLGSFAPSGTIIIPDNKNVNEILFDIDRGHGRLLDEQRYLE